MTKMKEERIKRNKIIARAKMEWKVQRGKRRRNIENTPLLLSVVEDFVQQNNQFNNNNDIT